ncbi:MAG TPA: FCD domain-containing protein [Roseiarcus sp.]|nr:FCD domain-containing protein [Roseiarcus sp.]
MPKLIAAEIEQSLRRRIESGEWSDSRRLPNERDLAAEYKVARNTVRGAIDKIAADGSLTREVGRGTFLRHGGSPDFMSVVQKLTGVSPIDMMAVRQIFEPRAAALAATNASANDIHEVALSHAAAVEAVDMETFEHWDAELHQRIFSASRNDLLNHLHEILRLIRSQDLWRDIKRRSFSPQRRQTYCEEHKAIVEALLRRDAEAAASAMRTHIDSVSRNLFTNHGVA